MCATARVGGRAVMKRQIPGVDHQKLTAVSALAILSNTELN
jgi:RNA 3'-terminal phosphate cyclase